MLVLDCFLVLDLVPTGAQIKMSNGRPWVCNGNLSANHHEQLIARLYQQVEAVTFSQLSRGIDHGSMEKRPGSMFGERWAAQRYLVSWYCFLWIDELM